MRNALGAASLLIPFIWFTVMAMAAPSRTSRVSAPAAYAPGVIAALVLASLYVRNHLFLLVVAVLCARDHALTIRTELAS